MTGLVSKPKANPNPAIPNVLTNAGKKTMEVCKVPVYTDGSKDAQVIKEFLMPNIGRSHPLFKNRSKITAKDETAAKKLRAKAEGYLEAAKSMAEGMNGLDAGKQKALAGRIEKKMAKALDALVDTFRVVGIKDYLKDKALMLNIAGLAGQLGQTDLAKQFYHLYFSQEPCDFKARNARMQLNQYTLTSGQQSMRMLETAFQQAATGNDQKQAQKIGQRIVQLKNILMQSESELALDGGLLFAAEAKETSEAITEAMAGFFEKDSAKQRQVLAEVYPMLKKLEKIAQTLPNTPLYQKTFAVKPKEILKKYLKTLVVATQGSDDETILQYAHAFDLSYHDLVGDKAYVAVLSGRMTQLGFKKLGGGDVKQGREKVETVYKKYSEAQNTLLQAQQSGDLGKMKAAQALLTEVAGDTKDWPIGFIDAYSNTQELAAMRKVRDEGLMTLGDNDAQQGRVKANEIAKKIRQLDKDVKAIEKAAFDLVQQGKIDEAKQKGGELQEKQAELETLMKEYSGKFSKEKFGQFVEALMILDGFEAYQQSEINKKALTVYKAYVDGIYRDEKHYAEDSYSRIIVGGFAASFRSMFGDDKTHFDDLIEENSRDRDIAMDIHRKLRKGEASTVLAGLEQVRDQSSDEAVKERAGDLLKKVDDDEFSLVTVLEYASSHQPSADKARQLLAEAQKLRDKGKFYTKTAIAIEQLVVDTCADPELVKLARSQMGAEQAKAA